MGQKGGVCKRGKENVEKNVGRGDVGRRKGKNKNGEEKKNDLGKILSSNLFSARDGRNHRGTGTSEDSTAIWKITDGLLRKKVRRKWTNTHPKQTGDGDSI